jgi:flagellar biosynthetic protein FlhB
MFSGRLARPDFSRLNPAAGLGRMLSARGWKEAFYLLFKAVGIAYVATRTFRAFQDEMIFYTDGNARVLGAQVWRLTLKMLGEVFLLVSGFAVWDYARERRRVNQELRMTKQEVKDEHRESEGNPQTKNRLRQLMRKMASRRMMSRVPKADVVITNPTHLAIAIRYRSTMKAPEVVAKGADLIAKRIREVALAHGVPLLENKPLAQLLYKKVEVGGVVPVALYQAVAEVLAYVYRRKGGAA